jgi:hypothetical protein
VRLRRAKSLLSLSEIDPQILDLKKIQNKYVLGKKRALNACGVIRELDRQSGMTDECGRP